MLITDKGKKKEMIDAADVLYHELNKTGMIGYDM